MSTVASHPSASISATLRVHLDHELGRVGNAGAHFRTLFGGRAACEDRS